MTLQSSGTITLSDVDVELERSATAPINMNEPEARDLADKETPDSLIQMSDFYGKSNTQIYTHTGTGYDLNMYALFGNPTSKKTFIFYNNGDIGGNPALSTGVFPTGSKIYIINNGRIQGAGGGGGWYNSNASQTLPVAGGTALYITTPIYEIQNSGIISGGGGGGGGSAEWGGENNNNAPGGGGAGIPVGAAGAVTWTPGYTYYPNAGGIDLGGASGYNASLGKGGDRGVAGNSGGAVGSDTNRYQAGGAAGASVVMAGAGSITHSKYVITANVANLTVDLSQQPGYVAGSSQLSVIINAGVYIYSNIANTAALSIIGGTAGNSISIVNNGKIGGMAGYAGDKYVPAYLGGTALNVARTTTIANNGYIGGGGGAPGTDGLFFYGGAPAGQVPGAGYGDTFPGTGGAGGVSTNDTVVNGLSGGAGSGGGAIGNTAGTANDGYITAGGGGGGWGAAGGTTLVQSNATTAQVTAIGGNGGAANSPAGNGSLSIAASASYAGQAGGKAINTNGNGVTITVGASRIYGIVG